MSQAKIDIQSKNLICAYWFATAAKEHLQLVWSDKHLIQDHHMKDVIKQVLPKINYFCSNIEKTFESENIKQQYLDSKREAIYSFIDEIWEKK